MKSFSYDVRDRRPMPRRRGAIQNARFIAGGTHSRNLMKLEIETPAHLVDVNVLALDKIEATPDPGLRIGALVSNTDLAADERVRRDYGALSRALLAGASGNCATRPRLPGICFSGFRCPYFYDTNQPCNKPVGSGCSAIGGYSRQHAVVGGSEACIAIHPATRLLRCARSMRKVETVQPDGSTRTIPIAELHRLPGHTPHVEIDAEAGRVDYGGHAAQANWRHADLSQGPGPGLLCLCPGFGRRRRAALLSGCVALGGVAHKPWRESSPRSANYRAVTILAPRGSSRSAASIRHGLCATPPRATHPEPSRRTTAATETRAKA